MASPPIGPSRVTRRPCPMNSFNLNGPALAETPDGGIWMGTGGGLSRFDPQTESFQTFHHDDRDPKTLAGESILYHRHRSRQCSVDRLRRCRLRPLRCGEPRGHPLPPRSADPASLPGRRRDEHPSRCRGHRLAGHGQQWPDPLRSGSRQLQDTSTGLGIRPACRRSRVSNGRS